MKTIEIKREISASPMVIWPMLSNTDLLQTHDTGILKIEGEIAAGSKFKLWSEVSPDRAFSLRVTSFVECEIMEWTGGMPLGIFTGRRRFGLTPKGASTQLHIKEDFMGPLSGLITSSMPDLQPSFEKFADAIQTLAEGATT